MSLQTWVPEVFLATGLVATSAGKRTINRRPLNRRPPHSEAEACASPTSNLLGMIWAKRAKKLGRSGKNRGVNSLGATHAGEKGRQVAGLPGTR